MEKTLIEIAEIIEGNKLGEQDATITGVTNIDLAGPGDITFAVEPFLQQAEQSKAAAVIVPDTVQSFGKAAIRVADPRSAFAKLLEIFTPPLEIKREVHPAAVIGKGVQLGRNVAIMPYAVVDDHAVIGDDVILYPHTYIGQYARVGAGSVVYSSATVREHCQIGCRNVIHSSAVIGSDGFGFVTTEGKHAKVPQVGNVVLGDDVEIGAHVGIDRATTGSTVIQAGTKIDNLVHIGHNCVIGENGLIVAQTGISGSTIVGHNVTFAGQSGTVGHIQVGDNCVFAARSGLIGNVESGSFYAGFPARPHQEWLRGEAMNKRVPDLVKKVRDLEKRLAALEK